MYTNALLPVDIRWPVRETNSTDGRPVTRENTSDAIFRSIGFHGPKPRARAPHNNNYNVTRRFCRGATVVYLYIMTSRPYTV